MLPKEWETKKNETGIKNTEKRIEEKQNRHTDTCKGRNIHQPTEAEKKNNDAETFVKKRKISNQNSIIAISWVLYDLIALINSNYWCDCLCMKYVCVCTHWMCCLGMARRKKSAPLTMEL